MPSFTSIAKDLLAQAEKIDELLEKNHIPPTSFERDTLEFLPKDAQKVRTQLLDLSHSFKQLLRGARLSGLDIALNWTEALILRVIWQYKLAAALPLDGSATYDEISAASGLSKALVARTIRSATTLNIFSLDEAGRVRHSAITRQMAENHDYNNALGLQLQDIGPASLRQLEVWEKLGDDTGEPEQSAFSLANGGRPIFEVFAEEPDRAHRFDSAMKYLVEDKDLALFDIMNAFDWPSIDKAGSRLVDLGGGYGQVSQGLSKHTQNLTFLIQDLPHVVEKGRKQLADEFAQRITFQGHSFLEPQSAEQAPPDVFLISRCLHNWSDRHCMIILRALIPALRKGSKVLIWDSVLDDSPVVKLSERLNYQQDFIMATISNGKDRSLSEFRTLLEESDQRFVLEGMRHPEGSSLSMIEVTWKG